MSSFKSDIINYLNFQKIYGKNIYFEENIDFKLTTQRIENNKVKSKEIETTKFVPKKKPKNNLHQEKSINKDINENSVEKNWDDTKSLLELNSKINNCIRCPLGLTRTKFVFGSGNENADVLIIGEAPGRDEDKQGKPFVGRAGQLLTKIIESIDLTREDVFIANILKCRPPNNRRPESEEVAKCEPYLMKQIEIIKPKIILALGLTAIDTLKGEKHKMKDIRGQVSEFQNTKLMVTYHPAALLRNPKLKRPVWEDMKKLKALIDS